MPDPRLWLLREALSAYASDPDDPPLRADDPVQAAVALVVRGGGHLDLLLIKRARDERDPWSGHMALPGGRRDAEDTDLTATAARETLEETGVHLAAHGVPLGRLQPVSTQGPRLPRLTIHPFVFGVPENTVARPDPREVDAVHWVRLDRLRDPDTAADVQIELHGGTRTFPALHVAGEVVWGLTYRILTDFFQAWEPDVLTVSETRQER